MHVVKTAKDLKIPYVWADRHPILLDRFLYIPGHYEHVKKSFSLFENDLPIIIEYCSGNGQWIGERARQNPHLNWVAVEKRFDRARQIWLQLHRLKLDNLCVVCGEGLVFTRYYAPTATEIYVNFPDPWPKHRHGKHRLLRQEFLQEAAQILPLGGKATCVTDDAKYAAQMEGEFSKCPEWKFLFNVNEWPDYGRSFFNDLWLDKGRTIHYLSYEKIG